MITFFVPGNPVPKQSFRYARGGSYTDPRVKAWQSIVRLTAITSMDITEPSKKPLKVELKFYLNNKRRVDLDNLSKAILDACNGILWEDDRQVDQLILTKTVFPSSPGVMITVEELS